MSAGLLICILFFNGLMWLFFKNSKVLLFLSFFVLFSISLLTLISGIWGYPLIPTHINEFTLKLDAPSIILSLYILLLGAIVISFSYHHLAGELRRHRFIAGLYLVITSALGLVQSANLISCWFFWTVMGWSIFALLLHEGTQEAKHNAILKRRISLFGDLCFLCACVISYNLIESSNFSELRTLPDSFWTYAFAGLMLLACMTKSVQIPFHFWLKKTLAAPTPTSAILHAGVVNAGAILMIKMYGLFEALAPTGYVLIIVGTLSGIYGHLQSRSALDIKQKLVYSTISQMGYVFVLCGAHAFAIALMHIISHGLVKASLFLNAAGLNQKTYLSLRHYTLQHCMKALLLCVIFLMMVQVFLSQARPLEISIYVWLGIVSISLYFCILYTLSNQNSLFKCINTLVNSLLYVGCGLIAHAYLDNKFNSTGISQSYELSVSWLLMAVTICALIHLLWQNRLIIWSFFSQKNLGLKMKPEKHTTRI